MHARTCTPHARASPLTRAAAWCAQNGHAAVVGLLLRASAASAAGAAGAASAAARVNARTVAGATPLFLACENGQIRCVRVLLRHGANPYECVEDGTWAAHRPCTTPCATQPPRSILDRA